MPSGDQIEEQYRSFSFEIPTRHFASVLEKVDPYYTFYERDEWNCYERDTRVIEGRTDVQCASLLGVLVEQAWAGQDHGAFRPNHSQYRVYPARGLGLGLGGER